MTGIARREPETPTALGGRIGRSMRPEGGFVPPSVEAADGPGEAVDAAIDAILDARHALEAVGARTALSYMDGAVVSLRITRAAILVRDGGRSAPTGRAATGSVPSRVVFASGLPTGTWLSPRRGDAGVGSRGFVEGGVFSRVVGADCGIARDRAVDLGAAVLASPRMAEIASTAVGSALLVDALSSWSWWHPEADRDWSASTPAAVSLVAALSGGLRPRTLSPADAGRCVDEDVLRGIEALGWRRSPIERRAVARATLH